MKLLSANPIFANILDISDMKEVIVNPDLMVTVNNDAPIPTAAATQILIRIVCARCNPKDWKFPDFSKTSSNSGDDMAGVVSSVGTSVLEFKSPVTELQPFIQCKDQEVHLLSTALPRAGQHSIYQTALVLRRYAACFLSKLDHTNSKNTIGRDHSTYWLCRCHRDTLAS